MTLLTAVEVRGGMLAETEEAFPLSADYIRAAAGKTNEKSAEQSVCGLYALLLLLRRVGADTRALRLQRTAKGKPYFAGSGYKFSIAHSESVAVASLSDAETGADVELLRPKPNAAALAARFFTREEAEYVAASRDKSRAFFRVWTRKEALIKRDGTGTDMRLDLIDTTKERFTELSVVCGGEYLVCATGDAEYIATEPTIARRYL